MNSRNILVVGGSQGIGYEIVRRLLAAGADVTAVSRSQGRLADGDLPSVGVLNYIQSDVTATVLTPEQLPDQIDGFVYCPGSINLSPLRGVKAEVMRSDFELNVVSAVTSFQAALKGINRSEKASAVFFSTVAAGRGIPMHTTVAAAKGAIEAIVRTWAAELSPKVRVNCIAPALTDTRLAERFLQTEAKREAMAAKYPLGRIGSPQDCAAVAEFLLSEESSWITGQVLAVDGGMSSIIK